jgi:hypothetical protein
MKRTGRLGLGIVDCFLVADAIDQSNSADQQEVSLAADV